MRRTLERELKLDPDPGFALPELPGAPIETRTFTSTYYDTPNRSLAHAGITLRRRVENGLSRWQLKLPRDGARNELESPGGPAGPPVELAELLVAHLRHGRLEQVATLRTRRSGIRVGDGDHPLADVTIDAVDVLDGTRSTAAFVELEVELVEGDEDDLDRLGRLLRRAGAHRSDGRPKLMRVLELEADADPGRDAPAIDHLRSLLAAQLTAIETYDPGVRLGDDPEDVHRMRVATRRARALIQATRSLLGDVLEPLEDELKWLAALLGDVRDHDVLLERLRTAVADLDDDRDAAQPIVAALEEKRGDARTRLLAGLADPRYLAVLGRFEEALAALPELAVDGDVKAIAAAAAKRLRRATEALPAGSTDDELHDLRKRAKKARYAAELAATIGGTKIGRYVEALKHVQDVIGEHQDAVVAEDSIRALAGPATALAAGRLIERERQRKAKARAAAPAALSDALARGRAAF